MVGDEERVFVFDGYLGEVRGDRNVLVVVGM